MTLTEQQASLLGRAWYGQKSDIFQALYFLDSSFLDSHQEVGNLEVGNLIDNLKNSSPPSYKNSIPFCILAMAYINRWRQIKNKKESETNQDIKQLISDIKMISKSADLKQLDLEIIAALDQRGRGLEDGDESGEGKLTSIKLASKKTLINLSAISESFQSGIIKVQSSKANKGKSYGNDIQKLHSDGYYAVCNRELFKHQFANSELVCQSQYALKGLGDIDFLIDISGSTTQSTANLLSICELEFSLAFAIGNLCLASKGKARYFPYASDLRRSLAMQAKTPQENRKLIKDYNISASGGTNLAKALESYRLSFWKRKTSTLQTGLVILTDGCDTIKDSDKEEILRWKKKERVKMYSYFFGAYPPEKSKLTSVFDRIHWIDTSRSIYLQLNKFAEIRF